MEVINVVSIAVFVGIMVAGISIKRYTRARLKEIDGLGAVHRRPAQNIIAKF
ncbi:MAG: hypothetical protein LUG13_01360 [Oscillospiraceae bacterium]|nr:hypothetical protein [Oscillospiraceae bacterium]